VKIRAFDPQAMPEARNFLKDVKFCRNVYETARGSDCLAVITEWDEFKEIDFKKLKRLLKQPLVVDGRNIYDPVKMRKLGFRYIGVGRS
jgi:UDPglucose 6-dehydrogenase